MTVELYKGTPSRTNGFSVTADTYNSAEIGSIAHKGIVVGKDMNIPNKLDLCFSASTENCKECNVVDCPIKQVS